MAVAEAAIPATAAAKVPSSSTASSSLRIAVPLPGRTPFSSRGAGSYELSEPMSRATSVLRRVRRPILGGDERPHPRLLDRLELALEPLRAKVRRGVLRWP